jgi:hypothetical protein
MATKKEARAGDCYAANNGFNYVVIRSLSGVLTAEVQVTGRVAGMGDRYVSVATLLDELEGRLLHRLSDEDGGW